MSNTNSSQAQESAHKNVEEMEVDPQSENAVHMPVPSGTGREAEQGRAERAPPGPACSKLRRSARSRSGSGSSTSSYVSSAPTTPTVERRSRKGNAREGNSLAVVTVGDRGGERSPIRIEPDEDGKESRSPDDREPPVKKRIAEAEDKGESSDGSSSERRRGRPRTTGLYVGRSKAQEEYNQKLREKAELDRERAIREMSIGQVFSKVGRGEESLEETVERLEMAPTADVANRTREAMAEVMRVARTSRNLQGSFVRILKQAAVTGAASAEVLRTRADSNEPESEILRQLQTMRLELDSTKREAQAAKEEANALRKKIAEMEVQQKRHRSTVTVPVVEDIQREAEDTGEGAPKILEFDDARRRREILPPQSEWPTTYRPALRGKVKVLEDRPLTGSKIRLADNKERSATGKNTKEAKQGGHNP